MEDVDLRRLLLLLGITLVMRTWVMGIAESQLGIRAAAHLMAHLERNDARHVRLPGQNHEIGHQLAVIREDLGDADGALDKIFLLALLLGQLYAPLNIADGLEILVDLVPIRSTDSQTQPSDFSVDRIKDAAIFLSKCQPCLGIGARVSKQTFEDGAGAVIHRQRCGLIAP